MTAKAAALTSRLLLLTSCCAIDPLGWQPSMRTGLVCIQIKKLQMFQRSVCRRDTKYITTWMWAVKAADDARHSQIGILLDILIHEIPAPNRHLDWHSSLRFLPPPLTPVGRCTPYRLLLGLFPCLSVYRSPIPVLLARKRKKAGNI